ncbi:hypothetical protein D3C87_1935680 [compost metagenome]
MLAVSSVTGKDQRFSGAFLRAFGRVIVVGAEASAERAPARTERAIRTAEVIFIFVLELIIFISSLSETVFKTSVK